MRHSKRLILILLTFFIGFLFTTCSNYRYFPSGNVQVGQASWYGEDFHGKKTANGETYNMYAMTAAHKTLPFESVVLVLNLKNKKSVRVRINDRGPFIKGRIIDLSYAAAKGIDMVGPGVVPVRIEVLQSDSPNIAQEYAVQVGSFIQRKNAQKLKKALLYKYRNTYITRYETAQETYFRVRIPVKNMKQAEKITRNLLRKGYTPFILEESKFK